MWQENDRITVTVAGRRALTAQRRQRTDLTAGNEPQEESRLRPIPILCDFLQIAEAAADFIDAERQDSRQGEAS